MGEIILNGKSYNSGMKYKEVTQAEYNALPSSKLTDGTLYCITDAPGPGEGFPPLIYSTEEREVGVWKDGKPLYQKTVVFGAIAANTINYQVDCDILIVDDLVDMNCIVYSGDFVFRLPVPLLQQGQTYSDYGINIQAFTKTTGKIRIDTGTQRAVTNGYVTIQYTKTTDQPGSGTWTPDGIYTKHYSTSEKVIGTWIDGKPIYEKTIEITTFPNSEIVYIAHGIANISEFIEIKGTAHVVSSIDSTNYWDSLSRVQDNNAAALIALGANDTNVCLKGRGSNMSGIYDYGYVTLQYTKTTD